MVRRAFSPPVFALILTALVLSAAGGMRTWADNELPRVKFLATGGTIATRGGTRLTAEEVLQLVPGLSRYARPEPEQFANVASTLTEAKRLMSSKRNSRSYRVRDAE